MASINNITYDTEEINKRIEKPELMLGKGSMMPFNASNSGSRKLMFGTHLEQRIGILDPEVPFIQTGTEKEFGKYSSSFIPVEQGLYVVGKIPKFSNNPNHHYYLLAIDEKKKEITMFERKQYKHVTESYGYIYDNETIDKYRQGDYIEKGTIIQKSTGFDEYNNRQDGRNLLVCYGSSEQNMEDGIVISESAAKSLTSFLIKKVVIMINDNEIPLNIYGNNEVYKIFPDIGESTKDGILCAVRVEKREEILFAQSWARLREICISDQPYPVSGTVIDVNVYPNNIELLNTNQYLGQIKYYYEDNLRMANQIVDCVTPYLRDGYSMTYDLQKLYYNCKGIISGKQYFSEKVYNNIIMEVVVLKDLPVSKGDKISNRYGGKGVVSRVKADYLMPRTQSGRIIDAYLNMCGVVGRENLGQSFETSVSYISIKIIEFCQEGVFDVGQCLEMYLKLIEIVSPSMFDYVSKFVSDMTDDEIFNFITTLSNDKSIFLVIEPISENMTIDKLALLYETFPFAKPERMMEPIIDSNNNVRYVESRRPLVYGYQYFYRLKQYAEEKFSVTSLSSTNIRNENSRNKASNSYKALYSRTPIRFGEMESGNLNHLGASLVVQMLMLYSTSPHARRLTDKLMTDDPFNIDVQLDDNSVNRNAEILNVYLKEIGLRLKFIKREKKKINPILIDPIVYDTSGVLKEPIVYYGKEIPWEIIERDVNKQIERDKNKLVNPIEIYPILFFDPQSEIQEI